MSRGFIISAVLNYLASVGASSDFQKNRLRVTSQGMETPDQSALKQLLRTFQGEDQQTRSQIAFATIVQKILTSESNNDWKYLLRNLVILDRVLQEMCFVQQICELQLVVIDSFESGDQSHSSFMWSNIVKDYWKLIKVNARVLSAKRNILCFIRSQRLRFIDNLTPEQVIQQIQAIEQLFTHCFTLIHSTIIQSNPAKRYHRTINNWHKSGLFSYLLLQLLYKLISYYSSQIICTNRFVSCLSIDENWQLQIQTVKMFKQHVIKFKNNSTRIIAFLEANKHLRGFSMVNYQDLDPTPGNRLITLLDQYITQRIHSEDNQLPIYQYLPYPGNDIPELTVRLKPQLSGLHPPRKHMQALKKRVEHSSRNNAFDTWISSYSEDFPQKQIMTLDLILSLKQQNDNEDSYHKFSEDIISVSERETCILNDAHNLPESITLRIPEQVEIANKFQNIYSGENIMWNYQ